MYWIVKYYNSIFVYRTLEQWSLAKFLLEAVLIVNRKLRSLNYELLRELLSEDFRLTIEQRPRYEYNPPWTP